MEQSHDQDVMDGPVLVTGIRVLDVICPIPLGGSLAISGDSGSGVAAVAMETMRNLCRRYEAKAVCRVTATEPFNEANVRGWVIKLRVGDYVKEIVVGAPAEISIAPRLLLRRCVRLPKAASMLMAGWFSGALCSRWGDCRQSI
jgi:F0F1-type ATP synthase alpha subunit